MLFASHQVPRLVVVARAKTGKTGAGGGPPTHHGAREPFWGADVEMDLELKEAQMGEVAVGRG